MVRVSADNVVPLARPVDAGTARRFEQFLAEQRDALVAFLRQRSACEADAQDAAQESMVRLMRYRGHQPVEAWKPLLYRIAINVAHDQKRRQHSRHSEAHHSLDAFDEELSADLPSQEQRVADLQELAAIRELILRLPERSRQIYLLNRIEGMSYSQIARHCGISVKAVEKHIAKALLHLRKGLGERGHAAYQVLP